MTGGGGRRGWCMVGGGWRLSALIVGRRRWLVFLVCPSFNIDFDIEVFLFNTSLRKHKMVGYFVYVIAL